MLLVVIAVVLAVGMEPVVAWLTRRGLRRGVAVAILLSSTALLVTIVASLIVPPLLRQASGLGADVPTYLSGLEARGDWLGSTMRANHVTEQVRGFIEHLPQMAGRSFGTILGLAGRVGGLVFGVVTVVVLTIYFMVSLPEHAAHGHHPRATAPSPPSGTRDRLVGRADRWIRAWAT